MMIVKTKICIKMTKKNFEKHANGTISKMTILVVPAIVLATDNKIIIKRILNKELFKFYYLLREGNKRFDCGPY